jgi:hypothetical protein
MRFRSGTYPSITGGCSTLTSCSLAAFYLFSVLFSGFSHILAYGLMQMEGVGGLRGWRWIFVRNLCLDEGV